MDFDALGLHEKYRCYYQGSKEALSLLERDRRGMPLAKLLATRARTALDMRSSIDYADDSRDFADGYAALAGIVADYARLCGELHSDVTQAGRPEPPWRVVERGRFAVRAPSAVRRPQPSYALEAAHGTWSFWVFLSPSRTQEGSTVTISGPISAGGPTATQVQWGRILPEWCDQLGYGFDALGVKVRLPWTSDLAKPDTDGPRRGDHIA